MNNQPQYKSAFVRALSDVLDEILVPPEEQSPARFSMMFILAKSLKPEIPGFLTDLDGNDGMRNMFGGIILRLGDAVRADNKAMKEAEKVAHKKAIVEDVGKVEVNGEEYHVKEERDE